MEALDGNAVAGQLMEIFGHEMTTAVFTCGTCGAGARVAEAAVYMRAPGTVARCRSCSAVLMVVTTIREINCVDLGGVADLRVD
jgi:Family of unknown function (DUF6510)